MAMIDDLAVRIPGASQDQLQQAINDAEGAIRDLCNRSTIPVRMNNLQLALAEVYARRMQAEGESSRTQGKVSVTYAYSKEIPEDLKQRILSYRKLRQARIANAHKES